MNKPGDQLNLFSSKAATRATDGPNSHEAADKLNNSGSIPDTERLILKALKENPGTTAKELGLIMASKTFKIDIDLCREIVYTAGQPHKRLAQMGNTVVKIEQSPANIYYERLSHGEKS